MHKPSWEKRENSTPKQESKSCHNHMDMGKASKVSEESKAPAFTLGQGRKGKFGVWLVHPLPGKPALSSLAALAALPKTAPYPPLGPTKFIFKKINKKGKEKFPQREKKP